jgi:hypothetical protein
MIPDYMPGRNPASVNANLRPHKGTSLFSPLELWTGLWGPIPRLPRLQRRFEAFKGLLERFGRVLPRFGDFRIEHLYRYPFGPSPDRDETCLACGAVRVRVFESNLANGLGVLLKERIGEGVQKLWQLAILLLFSEFKHQMFSPIAADTR